MDLKEMAKEILTALYQRITDKEYRCPDEALPGLVDSYLTILPLVEEDK